MVVINGGTVNFFVHGALPELPELSVPHLAPATATANAKSAATEEEAAAATIIVGSRTITRTTTTRTTTMTDDDSSASSLQLNECCPTCGRDFIDIADVIGAVEM